MTAGVLVLLGCMAFGASWEQRWWQDEIGRQDGRQVL